MPVHLAQQAQQFLLVGAVGELQHRAFPPAQDDVAERGGGQRVVADQVVAHLVRDMGHQPFGDTDRQAGAMDHALLHCLAVGEAVDGAVHARGR